MSRNIFQMINPTSLQPLQEYSAFSDQDIDRALEAGRGFLDDSEIETGAKCSWVDHFCGSRSLIAGYRVSI